MTDSFYHTAHKHRWRNDTRILFSLLAVCPLWKDRKNCYDGSDLTK